MAKLPIFEVESQLIQTIRENQVVVVAAPTGTGKSTEVPMMLHRAGFSESGRIVVTEPRRIAATSLAEYVAEKNECNLGEEIGYQIKGEVVLSHDTNVVYMTEGVLLRQIVNDPTLSRYSVVIVDEAHERGINQDLLIALLKRVCRVRHDLKLVIMSATIDEHRFAAHFNNAPVIRVSSKMFDVQIRYLDYTPISVAKSIETILSTVNAIIRGKEDGDILIFLPDEKSIHECCRSIEEEVRGAALVFPLYSSQSREDRRAALKMYEKRRIIVATNIAETSITIDGVVHVIDSGYIKQTRYVSATMSALKVVEHSKAGCDQRKGRAGRTRPGICYRLFADNNFAAREEFTKPEIQRMTIDHVLLQLRVMGFSMDDILSFEFMDPPTKTQWADAENLLKLLNAINGDGTVSSDGELLASFAVAPTLGKMLLTASHYGCVDEMTKIVAGFISRPLFVRPKEKDQEDVAKQAHAQFKDVTSDGITILNVCEAFGEAWNNEDVDAFEWARERFISSRALEEISRNRQHLIEMLEHAGIEITTSRNPVHIRKAIAAGLISNLCVPYGRYTFQMGETGGIFIHPGSSLFGRTGISFMTCVEVVDTTKAFARNCTEIEKSWIRELVPEHACEVNIRIHSVYLFDNVEVTRQVFYRGILLSETEGKAEDVLTPRELEEHREILEKRRVHALLSREADVLHAELLHEIEKKLREKREAVFAPLVGRLHELIESAKDCSEIISRAHAMKRRIENYQNARYLGEAEIDRVANQISFELKGLFAEVTQKYQMTTMIWGAVEHQFPVCPLCGSAWQESDETSLTCYNKHNEGQLIVVDPIGKSLIGYFYTSSDDTVAKLRLIDSMVVLSIKVSRKNPWLDATFEEINYRKCQVILPSHLTPQRETILADLVDLQRVRKKHEEILLHIRDVEVKVAAGEMKRLTFKNVGGIAVAKEGFTEYHAAYATPYPSEGETWYCTIGRKFLISGANAYTVYPQLQLKDADSEYALVEFEDLIKESYPGIPSELLH